jgi:hypothetical protein
LGSILLVPRLLGLVGQMLAFENRSRVGRPQLEAAGHLPMLKLEMDRHAVISVNTRESTTGVCSTLSAIRWRAASMSLSVIDVDFTERLSRAGAATS